MENMTPLEGVTRQLSELQKTETSLRIMQEWRRKEIKTNQDRHEHACICYAKASFNSVLYTA